LTFSFECTKEIREPFDVKDERFDPLFLPKDERFDPMFLPAPSPFTGEGRGEGVIVRPLKSP
jgi:hypothetical protein